MRKTLSCLFLLLIFSAVTIAVPGQISFQGVLKDSAGNPINGTRTVDFAIYDSPTGAGASWSETQTITIEAGLYNVKLGSVHPFTVSDFNGGIKYLAVSIGGSEILPRVVILTVPYAFRAEYADTAGSSGGISNAVLFNPPAQQTTSETKAIWVGTTKSGTSISNMTACISAETTGSYSAAITGAANNASATRAIGVLGGTNGLGPLNYGVLGIATGTQANGVYGWGTGANGIGVYGKGEQAGSWGVYGKGVAAGGSFESTADDGYAVYGAATNGGIGVGAFSDQGWAIYGRTDNPGGGAVAYFEHHGTNGDGVYAQASGVGLSGYFHGGQGICVDTNTFAESSTREGTISYVDGKFWGFTSGGWKQLDNL